VGLRHGANLVVECRGLVGELVGRKRLRMLRLHAKGVDILEMMRAQGMVVEAMEMGGRRELSSVDPAFRGWQGERRAQAKTEARRVQVAGLAVVERVGPAGRGRVVAGGLVCKRSKGEAVGV